MLKLLIPALICLSAAAQQYPHETKFLSLSAEGKNFRMAFMDVRPAKPNGKTAVLFHGKNFNGFYWKDVIEFLTAEGFRVVVPDQVGWGKSDKPLIHYSFHSLARNTKILLDTLKISKATIIGHSMGGMLATRFCRMYPEMADRLILENPIGLEDYRLFVPDQHIDSLIKAEESATYESYKKYQQSYYPVWQPAYEPLVQSQAEALKDPDFKTIAHVNALTYRMIYEQPVFYEFDSLTLKTLLIIGQEDRTIIGKAKLSQVLQKKYGQYPSLGKALNRKIRNSTLIELPGVGHIPHIQELQIFKKEVSAFLKSN
ncbi:MAG: alpha/beta hydrolase [Gemmatimonadaceae bacterium]|nr:alpha/beta hydrolase [Chitinophagaceae bacterium]